MATTVKKGGLGSRATADSPAYLDAIMNPKAEAQSDAAEKQAASSEKQDAQPPDEKPSPQKVEKVNKNMIIPVDIYKRFRLYHLNEHPTQKVESTLFSSILSEYLASKGY